LRGVELRVSIAVWKRKKGENQLLTAQHTAVGCRSFGVDALTKRFGAVELMSTYSIKHRDKKPLPWKESGKKERQ